MNPYARKFRVRKLRVLSAAIATFALVAGSVVGVGGAASAATGVTITGSPSLGGTLTANVTDAVLPITNYRWLRNGEPISGAAGASFSSYTPAGDDDRATTISVEVTDGAGTVTSPGVFFGSGSLTRSQTVVEAGTAFTITGALFAAGSSYSLVTSWQTYTLTADAQGGFSQLITVPLSVAPPAGTSTSTVTVTAIWAGGQITSTNLTVKAPVAPSTFRGSAPKIVNAIVVGSQVRADVGSWTEGSTFAYQWRIDGRNISGATANTFTIPASYANRTLSVRVIGSGDGVSMTAFSADREVQRAKFTGAPTVKLKGKAKVGRTLKAVLSGGFTPAPATVTYSWYSSGKKIAGANKKTFKVTKKYKGKRLQVRATATRAGYTTIYRTATSATIKKK
jgi:hypothetical protein